MPARDHSLYLVDAVVVRLRADTRLKALGVTAIEAEQPPEPVWPWVRVGPTRTTPTEFNGSGGGETGWMVHGFADDRVTAHKIGQAITYSLDEHQLAIVKDPDDPTAGVQAFTVECWVEASDVLPDSDRNGGYHAFVRLTATTAEDV